MTCIVGLVHKGTIYLGADSSTGDSQNWIVRSVQNPKLIQKGPMSIGFTSSWRMGQLLEHQLVLPPRLAGQSEEAYLVVGFVEAVRDCLKKGGYAHKEHEVERGGVFLVGFEGKLYEIDWDYHVEHPREEWTAIGCGQQFALGSLHSTEPRPGLDGTREDFDPKVRLQKALNAAAHFSAYVRGPFTVLQGLPHAGP